MADRAVPITQGDLPVTETVFTRPGAEEPRGQESERPYERGSAGNRCGAKGRREGDA
jgi:hypothetical protein